MITGLAVMITGLAVMPTGLAVMITRLAVMPFLGLFDAVRPSFFHPLDLGPGFSFLFFAHIVPSVFHPRAERRMTVGRMPMPSIRLTMVATVMATVITVIVAVLLAVVASMMATVVVAVLLAVVASMMATVVAVIVAVLLAMVASMMATVIVAVLLAVVAAGSGVITVTFSAMTFPSFFNALLPSRLHAFAGLGSLLFTHAAPSFSPIG